VDLGRRALVFGAAATVATSPVQVAVAATRPQPNPERRIAQRTINGVRVTVLVMEHDQQALDLHGDMVRYWVDRSDVIVPEYFRDEYRHLETDPLIGEQIREFAAKNALFDAVAEQCGRLNKNVWVVDPAYGKPLAAMHGMGVSAEWTAFGASLAAAATGAVAAGFQKSASRRNVLLGGAGLLTAATVAKFETVGDMTDYLVNDFREVMAADQVVGLCRSGAVRRGSELLLIYPSGHWDGYGIRRGMDHYMRNDAARTAIAAVYGAAMQYSSPETLRARNYPLGDFEPDPPTFVSLTMKREFGLAG
jgi:hypothetical protein